jgi:dTDP-4-amino-4,6-dideoxygalactose transaminase
MLKLAAYGGTKVRKAPLLVEEHSKARFGKEEKKAVAEVIDSGHLCRVFGAKAKRFENEISEYFSVSGAAATTSGTAAIHCALAAVGIGPGDEVITSPITDMGSVIPILALNAIPVFADVDPKTYNITAETIKAVLTNRTKAVIPVHFIGQSCVMEPILHLAKKHDIYVIEDCAQSYTSPAAMAVLSFLTIKI